MKPIAKFGSYMLCIAAFMAATYIISDVAWNRIYKVDAAEIQRHYLTVMYADAVSGTLQAPNNIEVPSATLQFIEEPTTSNSTWLLLFACEVLLSVATTYIIERLLKSKFSAYAAFISTLVSVTVCALTALLFNVTLITPTYIVICVSVVLLCSACITEHYK